MGNIGTDCFISSESRLRRDIWPHREDSYENIGYYGDV